MSQVGITASEGGVYEVVVSPGQTLQRTDKVTVDNKGRLMKAKEGDSVLGMVIGVGSQTATISMEPGSVVQEISPDGTMCVWDEVDLETGRGGRV